MIKVRFMDTSFRDGFQSVYGARVLTNDFMPAVEAARDAGIDHFEAGGGARFQSLFFYCNESAFDMMDIFREKVGSQVELQTLARGINTVCLSQSPRDIIELHARMFKKHGITIIRNFDALNDINNLRYSGKCISNAGLHHQIVVTMMGLPVGCEGAHDVGYYVSKVREIIDSDVPYDSLCFKDASGTACPQKVYETLKTTRAIVGDDMLLWFHTHDTAGNAVLCYDAAIKAAATKDNNFGICLCRSPVSGGTAQPDIITMWHSLKGTNFDLDVDILKILESEEIFENCMKNYFVPAEAKRNSPIIPLSPMPGGALTANTMMMRDTGTLELFPEVIKEMSDVVRRGGLGTSVTPLSQFYFQQAYANVTEGRWKKITEGYGNVVLGYFGKTPIPPDEEIVGLASKQLGKEVFTGNPLDLLESAIPPTRALLEEHELEVTDENVFIVFACGKKSIDFLKGKAREVIRKVVEKPAPLASVRGKDETYAVTVNGKQYEVATKGDTMLVNGKPYIVEMGMKNAKTSQKDAQEGEAVIAAMPGAVMSVEAAVGDAVKAGDVLLVVEAMKMESPVRAPKDGTIITVEVGVGDTVATGDTLVVVG